MSRNRISVHLKPEKHFRSHKLLWYVPNHRPLLIPLGRWKSGGGVKAGGTQLKFNVGLKSRRVNELSEIHEKNQVTVR